MANTGLYQFGLVQWRTWPLNTSEVTHTTGTDYARKEIAGAPIFREWVGENDEEITMRGRVFPRLTRLHNATAPKTLGNYIRQGMGDGMGDLDVLDEMRRFAQVHPLVRGDGVHLGWFAIERLSRGHQFLDETGVGQQIDFEASFQRMPAADPETYYRNTSMFIR